MADDPRPDSEIVFTPTGWFLLAVRTHCEPVPCPSVPVLLILLGIALVGTVSLWGYVSPQVIGRNVDEP